MKKHIKRAVTALRKALENEFGEHLKDIIVFGSVARGADTEASDIDVMIVMDSLAPSAAWQTEKSIRSVAFNIELEHDIVFDIKVTDRNVLHRMDGQTPFMERVFAEGIRS